MHHAVLTFRFLIVSPGLGLGIFAFVAGCFFAPDKMLLHCLMQDFFVYGQSA